MVQCPWSHNARRPVQFGLVCCTIVAATPGSATCLSDAIPASSRKLVGLVDSYPLGMWVNDWPAGHAVAEMMAIIIQEVMGYEVEMKGPGAGTVNGFFALAGCRKPMDSQDPDCDGVTRTLVHMNVEGWTEGYTPTWQMVQDKYPSMAPRNLGNAGYFGDARAHISTPVQEMAYNAEGLSLDFYRELNASWNDVKRYFADLDSVDKSRLRFCNGTLLMDPVEMGIYAEMTGDLDGVVFEGAGGSVVAKCWQNHFWYAPACRQSPSRCWPFITGGSGWQVGDFMQKATAFNFAAAVAVAKNWDNYVSLPTDHASIFYWWVPDTTFLRMKPQAVTFPAYDRIAWERGDKKTGSKQMSIDIHVSQDLAALAPSVQQLLAASSLTIKDVNDVMLDTLDSGITYRDAVCRWLNAKTERWRKWLPDKTLCVAGFGLYDISADVFVQSRSGDTANIECRVCPSGHFSDRLQDDKGDKGMTFICQPCPAGRFQASAGMVSCDPCPKGEYQGSHGSQACLRCDLETYQDVEGQAECKQCPAGTSTLGLGSISQTDCGCEADSINVPGDNSTASTSNVTVASIFQCQPCGEGLRCPFSSAVENLIRGQSTLGPKFTPEIQEGYVSDPAEPTKIFKCQPAANCPGGKPGTCSGGLQGKLCSRCSAGEAWIDGACTACETVHFVGWCIFGTAVLGGSLASYFVVNLPGSRTASPLQLVLLTFGLVIYAVQTVALFGMMSVTWPSIFTSTSGSLQFAVLDLSRSTLTCLTGWGDTERFMMFAMVFPVLALWVLLAWAISHYFPIKRWPSWVLTYTFNTIGVFCQAGFASICAIAFQPMMCYAHPNGIHSVLKYPGTFCGDDQHAVMLAFGAVLCFLAFGFLVVCSVAAWKIPKWSMAQERQKVQAFRFLTGKFRLDIWWFGVLLLFRGLGFSLVIVIFTDLQRAEITSAFAILLVYTIFAALYLPWKARSINVADLALNALLLLLVTQSTQDFTPSEQQFATNATLGILMLMAVGICGLILYNSCIAVASLMGYSRLVQCTGRGSKEELTAALKSCAEKLLELEKKDLESSLESFTDHDIKALENTIAIVSTELHDGRWAFFKPRLSLEAMNSRIASAGAPFQPTDAQDTSNDPSNDQKEDKGHVEASNAPFMEEDAWASDGQVGALKVLSTAV